MATPKISVVVPIYNVEEYLAWCLDSLLAQDMPDWEGVLVNDGSPDGSRDIAAAYCEKDARFTLVDKENGGLSSARNAGIAASTSPIVAFLDSDDRFTPDACRVIVDAFEREDCDVLTFGANPYPLEAGYPWLNRVLSPRDVSFHGYSFELLFKEDSRPFVWRTACRRVFLANNAIQFDESICYGEDQVFEMAIYGRSRKTTLISNKLYDYRVARKGSLMDTMRYDDETRLLEHVKIYSAVLADWHRDGLDTQHVDDLAYFLCDLVLYDAIRLLGTGCGKVFDAVSTVLAGSAMGSDAALTRCAPSVAAMVRAARANKAPSVRACRRLMFEYDVFRSGLLRACKRMAANILGKRDL